MNIQPRAPISYTITITCSTEGATILYRTALGTTDRLESQEDIKSYIKESPIEYKEPFTVQETFYCYAYATKDGYADSDAVSIQALHT